jgi:phage/plasmid-like protein (TIGR03299 family)
MFYVREDGLPWHGEGTPLDGPATWGDAVKHGGLDWLVDERPVYYAGETRPDGAPSFHEIPDRFAVVRSDTGNTLGVVSGNYRPIQNKDLFDFVDPLIAENEASFRTAGVIGKGERVWALAKLADTIDVRAGDRLDFYLLLTAAHDGKHSADFMLTTVRVVCENTFNAAYGQAGESARGVVRVKHTGDVKAKMQEAHRVLGISRQSIAKINADVTALVNASITTEASNKVLEFVFATPSPRPAERPEDFASRVGKVVALRQRSYELAFTGKGNGGGTLWDLVNGVTDLVDHELVTRSRKSALLYTQEGEGARLKARAFESALALAA